jgi:hypothetical protein
MTAGRKITLLILALALLVAGAMPVYQHWKREYGPLDDSRALAAWAAWQGPSYTRSECAVRVKVERGAGAERVWDELFPTFTRYLYNNEPKALFSMGWDRQHDMILQFFDDCPRRHDIARAMTAYFQRRHGDAIGFTVTDDQVTPGPETMQACGPHWTDCEAPPGGWNR